MTRRVWQYTETRWIAASTKDAADDLAESLKWDDTGVEVSLDTEGLDRHALEAAGVDEVLP